MLSFGLPHAINMPLKIPILQQLRQNILLKHRNRARIKAKSSLKNTQQILR